MFTGVSQAVAMEGRTVDKASVQLALTYAKCHLTYLKGDEFKAPSPTLNKPLLVADALSSTLGQLTEQLENGLEPPDATFLAWPTLVTTVREITDYLNTSRKPVLGAGRDSQRALVAAGIKFLECAEILRDRPRTKFGKNPGKNPSRSLKDRVEPEESDGSDGDSVDRLKTHSNKREVDELELRYALLESELEETKKTKGRLEGELKETKQQLQEDLEETKKTTGRLEEELKTKQQLQEEKVALTDLLGKKEWERAALVQRASALETDRAKLQRELVTKGKEIRRLQRVACRDRQEKDEWIKQRKTLLQKLETDMQLAGEFRRRLELLSRSGSEIKQAVDEVKRLQQQTLVANDVRHLPSDKQDGVMMSLPGDVKALCVHIQQLVGGHGRLFTQALLGPYLDFSKGDLEEEGWFMTPRKFWLLVGRWVKASMEPQTLAPATLDHLVQACKTFTDKDPRTLEDLGREERQLLEGNFDYFCHNLETLELAVALRSLGLLSEDAWYFLTMPGNSRQKVDRLLAVVYSLGKEGLRHFLGCLDSYQDHVRQKITQDMKERNITLPDDVTATQCPASADDVDRNGEKTYDNDNDDDGNLDPLGSQVTGAADPAEVTLEELDGMSEKTRKQLGALRSDVKALLTSVTEFSGNSSREGRDLFERVKAIEETLGLTLKPDTWVKRDDLDGLYHKVKDVVQRCFDNVSEDLRAKLAWSDSSPETGSSQAAS